MSALCGSQRGYQRHQMAVSKPCLPCIDAHTVYMKVWRIKTGKSRSLNISMDALRETLLRNDCAALVAFLGEDVAEAVRQSPDDRQKESA